MVSKAKAFLGGYTTITHYVAVAFVFLYGAYFAVPRCRSSQR